MEIKLLTKAVRAFNSATGEHLEVYGDQYDEIFQRLKIVGVPPLDIVNSEKGFLISVDGKMPEFYVLCTDAQKTMIS